MEIEKRIEGIIEEKIQDIFDHYNIGHLPVTSKAIAELFDTTLNDFVHEISVTKNIDLRKLDSNSKAQLIIDFLNRDKK